MGDYYYWLDVASHAQLPLNMTILVRAEYGWSGAGILIFEVI